MKKKEDFSRLPLEQLRKVLADHMKGRPSDLYSPEMATWMARKDSLVFNIDLTEGEARSAWRPATGPAREAKATKPVKAPLPEPEPARSEGPQDDVVALVTRQPAPQVPPVDRGAEEQMTRLFDKLKTYARTCEAAKDQAAFLAARQGMYQARFDLLRLVRRKKLAMPSIPPIPANPWTKPRGKKAVGPPEVATAQVQVA